MLAFSFLLVSVLVVTGTNYSQVTSQAGSASSASTAGSGLGLTGSQNGLSSSHSPNSSSLGLTSSSSSTSDSSSSSSQALAVQTSSAFYFDPNACGTNCTLDILEFYRQYQSLHNLYLAAGGFVVLANVTSELTTSVSGVPVTAFNITVISNLKSGGHPSAGSVVTIAQVGGSTAQNTMTLKGYPLISKGGTYVFFLQLIGGSCCGSSSVTAAPDPLQRWLGGVDNGFAYVSVGGPQGVFVVQNGAVSSLDSLYPQDDGWLPVKVSGVPLAQFIQEVQSAITTSTSSTVATSSSR
jgi:hypothetical protein